MVGFLPKIAVQLDFSSVEFFENETFTDLNKGIKKLMVYAPIIAEIRKIRDDHSKKINYNVNAIFEDYDNRHDEIMSRLKNIKNNFNKVISQDTHSSRPRIQCSEKKNVISNL